LCFCKEKEEPTHGIKSVQVGPRYKGNRSRLSVYSFQLIKQEVSWRGGYIFWAGCERTDTGIDIENASGTTWFVEKP
jgi:hypothetical protein